MSRQKLIGFALVLSAFIDVGVAFLVLEPPALWILLGSGLAVLLMGAVFLVRGWNAPER